jgi:hypothetical protein
MVADTDITAYVKSYLTLFEHPTCHHFAKLQVTSFYRPGT